MEPPCAGASAGPACVDGCEPAGGGAGAEATTTAPPADGGGPPAHDLLTVVMTTSPIPSHPSLEMLERVLTSFSLVPGLTACRRVIVCDNVKLVDTEKPLHPKRGQVHPDLAKRYWEAVRTLRARVDAASDDDPLWGRTSVHVMDEWGGYSWALKRGLAAVTTPYVMVVQHDWAFLRPVSLPRVLAAVAAEGVNYVKLVCKTTLLYPPRSVGRHGITVSDHYRVLGDTWLVPMVSLFDKVHVARVDWYHDVVFAHKGVRRGCFPEDTFGQFALRHIKAHGMNAHKEFGMFMFYDVAIPASSEWERRLKVPATGLHAMASLEDINAPAIGHMDGRAFKTAAQREARIQAGVALRSQRGTAGPVIESAFSNSTPNRSRYK